MRLGEEKNEERKKKQDKNIMSASATQGGHDKKNFDRRAGTDRYEIC